MSADPTILIQAAIPVAFACSVGLAGCAVAWWTKPASNKDDPSTIEFVVTPADLAQMLYKQAQQQQREKAKNTVQATTHMSNTN